MAVVRKIKKNKVITYHDTENDVVANYIEDIKNKKDIPLIEVVEINGYYFLIDGHHRLSASGEELDAIITKPIEVREAVYCMSGFIIKPEITEKDFLDLYKKNGYSLELSKKICKVFSY